MIIFTKISLLVLLVLSEIYTSESRRHSHHHHHHHKKPKGCSCQETDQTEPEPLEESQPETSQKSIVTTEPDFITEDTLTTDILPVANQVKKTVHSNKSGKPLSPPLIPLYDVKEKFAPVEQYNVKSKISNNPFNSQRLIKYPGARKMNVPLYSQVPAYFIDVPRNEINEYGIDPQFKKSVYSPYNYVVQTREIKLPPKISKYYPRRQYGTDPLLKLKESVKTKENVPENLIIPSHENFKYIFPYPVYGDKNEVNTPNSFELARHVESDVNQNMPTNYQTATLKELKSHAPHAYEHLDNNYNTPISPVSSNEHTLKPESEKFGLWIKQQVDLLNNKKEESESINLTEVGYAVLQILSENGMHINDNGMLIDSNGILFNIQTLNLTPIIIGNTMSLQSLLQGKYGVKTMELQTPYLQAVLVTATHPLKVLGIMPLSKIDFPFSLMTGLSSVQSTQSKSGKNETEFEDITPEEETISEKDIETFSEKEQTDIIKSNKEEEENYKYKPNSLSNNININGNENSVAWKRLGLTLRHGYRPNDVVTKSHPYSRTHKLLQGNDKSHSGRLFIPDIEFRHQRVISRDAPELIALKDTNVAPGMSNLLNLALKSESLPINVKSLVSLKNKAEAIEADSLSNIFETIQSPAAQVLHHLNVKEGIPISDKVIMNRRFNLPYYKHSVEPIIRKSYSFHTIPLDYTRVPTIPDWEFPAVELGVSRSGGDNQAPQSPPEINNGNNAFEIAENDDDDDGDFRIIGGNAATGSGTPLSNKGRSGFVA